MRKRTAFTLIELLVVISVVVLLIALLLPALHKSRNQTRMLMCQANLKQWGTVLALYVDENEGRLPVMSGGTVLWVLSGGVVAGRRSQQASRFPEGQYKGALPVARWPSKLILVPQRVLAVVRVPTDRTK